MEAVAAESTKNRVVRHLNFGGTNAWRKLCNANNILEAKVYIVLRMYVCLHTCIHYIIRMQ